ncbi:MAG: hypothetical protein R3B06_28550 [Kofleriaceae bacterium]
MSRAPHAAVRRGGLAALVAVGAAALGAVACDYPAGQVDVPPGDPTVFRDQVYPVLLRDCAFSGCHGNPDRFFTVYGPARTRLDPTTDMDAPVTAEELAETYTRARSMLISPSGIKRSPLLRKPLAVAAGGAGHRGTDPWGAAPYASKSDPSYQVLVGWALAGGGQ